MVKNSQIVNVSIRYRKKGFVLICYKNALSEQVFGNLMHFQISLSFWELQVVRDWLCVRDIAETSLNRLLLFLILKSHRSCPVEKGVLIDFTKKTLLLEPLFNKFAGLRACNTGVFHWNLQNFWEHLFLNNCVFV